MPALRFHRDLYAASALDEAIRVFSAHGTFNRQSLETHDEVTIVAATPADEPQLVGEFANYVLALTIDKNRA